jgi:hypothetical protein
MPLKVRTNNGVVFEIDQEDYDRVRGFHLHAQPDTYTTYIYIRVKDPGARKIVSLSLHRYLLKPPPGSVVDHKDRNGLNNTRENLRICTQSQNVAAAIRPLRGKSGFLGVEQVKHRWKGYFGYRGYKFSAGVFDSAEEAARARDALAHRLSKGFARLNFPLEPVLSS